MRWEESRKFGLAVERSTRERQDET